LGIIAAPAAMGSDYVAVILRSTSPIWQQGEIKAEIRSTASPEVFTATYFMLNKQPMGTTLALDHNVILKRSTKLKPPTGETDLMLTRVWPPIATDTAASPSTTASGGVSGTGFLLTRSVARVVIRDVTNDLAVLRFERCLKDSRGVFGFSFPANISCARRSTRAARAI